MNKTRVTAGLNLISAPPVSWASPPSTPASVSSFSRAYVRPTSPPFPCSLTHPPAPRSLKVSGWGAPVGVGGQRGIQNGGGWGGGERGHRVGDKLCLRGWALFGDMGLVCQGPLPGQLYLGEVEKQRTVGDYGTVGSGGAQFPWGLDPSESRVVRELEQEWKGWELPTTQPQRCPL